jgi:hypothetical protein
MCVFYAIGFECGFKELLMNICRTALPVAAAMSLCLTLYPPSWAIAASAGEGSFQLTEQVLEDLRQEGLPSDILKRLKSLKDREFRSEDAFLEAVRQELGKDQTTRYQQQILQYATDDIAAMKRAIETLQAQNQAQAKRLAELEAAQHERAQKPEAAEPQTMRGQSESRERKQLEQRVKELELAETAREAASRSIIRDALSTLGSKINEFVTLGGTLEVLMGSAQVFEGQSERVLRLSTAQLDFEIQASDWALGNLVVQYDDGTGETFRTTEGFETGVDRINIDTASITIGNPQRFPPFVTAGRIIVPFGISTGNPVADVLTIEDPLTIEAFETKEDAILMGVGLPTPPLTPAAPPVTPPPVSPRVLNPLVSALAKHLGYKPPPIPPPLPTPMTPKPPPPLFTAGIYLYNGDTRDAQINPRRGSWPTTNYGATLGFHTKGHCGRPYDQLRGSAFCPWSIDVDVDFNNSLFDSRFLAREYRGFLNQIGFVPGLAGSVKATLGPLALVGEWNGAIGQATFTDDLGTSINIKPSAWEISLGYQFDWNPWVEAIGAQGTYLAIGYSQSTDLAGVSRVFEGVRTRVGTVPKRRFLVGAGEWFLDNLRLAIEYSYNQDYRVAEGGTGNSAHGVFVQLTAVW